MREYEVIHQIHQHHQQPSIDFPTQNFNLEILHPTQVFSNSNSTPLTPTTTIIIRQKYSIFHRLSRSITLWNYSSQESRRTNPEMKTKQRWILLLFILFSIFLILLLSTLKFSSLKLSSHELGITIDLEELTDRHKCPACYGVNLCPHIFTQKIELNDWNKFSMSRLVNVKNVFYATFNDEGIEKQVVLKKLGHDSELATLDKMICSRHYGNNEEDCSVSDTVRELIDKYKKEDLNPRNPIMLHGEKIGEGSDLLLCHSDRKMNFILNGARKRLRGAHDDTILANVLTMLLLNPEPLLLQIFPENEGWPFPKYYGACGRIIVEEYVGRLLSTFYNEAFDIRASLSLQLLKIIALFKDNPTDFILYPTDMNPHNFAVTEYNYTIKLIDLENIIMVDKREFKNDEKDYKLVESAESTSCNPEDSQSQDKCFRFSPNELCSNRNIDHNEYALCAGLLAPDPIEFQDFPNGLLHSLPTEFNTNEIFKNFKDILLKCKDPKLGNPNLKYNRIEAAKELRHLLEVYLKLN